MPRYARLCHACRQFAAGLPPKKGGGKQLHPLFIGVQQKKQLSKRFVLIGLYF